MGRLAQPRTTPPPRLPVTGSPPQHPPSAARGGAGAGGGNGGGDVGGPGTGGQGSGDGPLARVAKYIPAEAVTFFLAAKNLIEQSTPKATATAAAAATASLWMNVVFVVALVLLPVYLAAQREQHKPWIINMLVSTVAFPIWVYALACDFGWFAGGSKLGAGLLVLIYTFAVGAIPPRR